MKGVEIHVLSLGERAQFIALRITEVNRNFPVDIAGKALQHAVTHMFPFTFVDFILIGHSLKLVMLQLVKLLMDNYKYYRPVQTRMCDPRDSSVRVITCQSWIHCLTQNTRCWIKVANLSLPWFKTTMKDH